MSFAKQNLIVLTGRDHHVFQGECAWMRSLERFEINDQQLFGGRSQPCRQSLMIGMRTIGR